MTQRWFTLADVCALFMCSERVVRAQLRVPHDAVVPAWTNQGTATRPRYRFGPGVEEIERWWGECNAWRTRESSKAGSTKSAGAIPTAKSAGAASRGKRTQKRTSAKSAGAKNAASSGGPKSKWLHRLSLVQA